MDFESPQAIIYGMISAALLTLTAILTTKAVNAAWPVVVRSANTWTLFCVMALPTVLGTFALFFLSHKTSVKPPQVLAAWLSVIALFCGAYTAIITFLYCYRIFGKLDKILRGIWRRLDALEKASGHGTSSAGQ